MHAVDSVLNPEPLGLVLVVIRTSVVYAALLVALRVAGKRELGTVLASHGATMPGRDATRLTQQQLAEEVRFIGAPRAMVERVREGIARGDPPDVRRDRRARIARLRGRVRRTRLEHLGC